MELGAAVQESGFKHIFQATVAVICYSYPTVDFNSYPITVCD
jgi:hypothetical protein